MGHFFGLLHTFEKQITQQSDVSDKNGDKICETHPTLLVQVSPKVTATYSAITKTETARISDQI
jgi:hypothetical protein